MSVDVTWTPLADTYLPADLRNEFLAEAEQSTWREVAGPHPMSPGLALKEIVEEFDIKGVSHVAYDRTWFIRDDNYRPDPAAEGTDQLIYATILGIRCDVLSMVLYHLDLGHGIVPIALLDTKKEQGR